MRVSVAFVAATIACASAFAPATKPTKSTALFAEKKKSAFSIISGLDLFAPKSDQNDYGARNKKKIVRGKIDAKKSYVPSGMTASQYNKIRSKEDKKKRDNYAKNVAKAGVFEDYTEWYKARGTDRDTKWMSVTNGHRMAKTKYNWGDTTTAKDFSKKVEGKKGRFGRFGKK